MEKEVRSSEASEIVRSTTDDLLPPDNADLYPDGKMNSKKENRGMMDCQSATCDFCHMSYCSNVASDVRQHEKHHQHCLNSYQQALIKYKNTTAWFRPEIENAGVYLALNELNPRLIGFQYSGITEQEWLTIQSGQSALPIGQGSRNGHDRHGTWQALDGTVYRYHANWRCGRIHFWKSVIG